MHLYTTDQGLARALDGETLELLDLEAGDVGELLWRDAGLVSARKASSRGTLPIKDARLRAPVPRPGTVYCVGANYESHVEEMRSLSGKVDDEVLQATLEKIRLAPMFFSVPSSAVTGPFDDLVLPTLAPRQVDYEIEVAVVVGRGGKNIPVDRALDAVAGLTLANDVSARDLQAQAMSAYDLEFGHAKGLDGFKPMGPCLVTPDALPEPQAIALETQVNGEVRQSATLADLIHDVPTCVAHLSTYHTLRPGDVILTGSPAGVGFFSGTFLQPGDVVTMTAAGIGTLRNVVVNEEEQQP